MRNLTKHLCCLSVALSVSSLAWAETAYVTDQVVVSLREGKGSQYKAITAIRTGTSVEVLERDPAGIHVKIRLQSGEEGYVPAQYLIDEPPKQVVVARLEDEVERLRAQLAATAGGGSAPAPAPDAGPINCGEQEAALTDKLNAQARALSQAHDGLREMTDKYNTLLAKSQQVVELADERDRLQKDRDTATAQLQTMRAQGADLKRTDGIKWFLAGGGVMFCGWLIGRASRKRKAGSRLLD